MLQYSAFLESQALISLCQILVYSSMFQISNRQNTNLRYIFRFWFILYTSSLFWILNKFNEGLFYMKSGKNLREDFECEVEEAMQW